MSLDLRLEVGRWERANDAVLEAVFGGRRPEYPNPPGSVIPDDAFADGRLLYERLCRARGR